MCCEELSASPGHHETQKLLLLKAASHLSLSAPPGLWLLSFQGLRGRVRVERGPSRAG